MSNEHLDDINEEMFTGDEESYDLDETESATPSVNPVRNQPSNIERDEKGNRDVEYEVKRKSDRGIAREKNIEE
ncbi:hypothetical protein PVK06_028227 [Gossypium arboreum]|uniref:Uncharacterized protein n=1 Tax=Gossypium arboreum TaxID=29729 RepID=A0ABR0P464_GOSAR|nr:hypothetical protein PVK06_028227 [Gossypium arboreum]